VTPFPARADLRTPIVYRLGIIGQAVRRKNRRRQLGRFFGGVKRIRESRSAWEYSGCNKVFGLVSHRQSARLSEPSIPRAAITQWSLRRSCRRVCHAT
jgi:hypothetical protein